MCGNTAVHTHYSRPQMLEDLKCPFLYNSKANRLEGVTIQTQTLQVVHSSELWRQAAWGVASRERCLGCQEQQTHSEVGTVYTCMQCNTDVCTTHTTHKHTHTCIHTSTQTHTHAHTHTRTHTHTCTPTCTPTHSDAHTHTQTHAHTHTQAYVDDALTVRVWVDLEQCKKLVENITTIFHTAPPPEGSSTSGEIQ